MLVGVFVLLVIGFVGWRVIQQPKDTDVSQTSTSVSNADTPQQTSEPKISEPDSADTLATPSKITSSDTKTYFYYGAPAGQNNKATKRIIISLPGHGTTAEDGYKAWSSHMASLNGGTYALAEFNWWRGTGEKKTDYYSPGDVVKQVRAFLNEQKYDQNDIVVLHGFSRGSANTYAVIANDQVDKASVFDAVISNAGKYQSDFPLFDDRTASEAQMTQYFEGIPWVLACGGTDPNPERDGCNGMKETETFLLSHKAKVLGTVTDPALGHGAFHMSSLGLPKQAIDLIEAAL
jgi:hypothetical protein